jgi:hypothetical protein
VSLSAKVVQDGGTITVSFGSPYHVAATENTPSRQRTCRVWVTGNAPGTGRLIREQALSGTMKTRLDIKGLPPGPHTITVACRRVAQTASGPFIVVPQGEATKASCEVVEQGFTSEVVKGQTTYGLRLFNRSKYLAATNVSVKTTFLDAAGNELKSFDSRVMAIPANGSALAGANMAVSGTASMRFEPTCDTSVIEPIARLSGTAAPSGIWADARITNTHDFPIDGRYSHFAYVFRNTSGQITGGTEYPFWTSADSLAPGETTTARLQVVMPAGAVATVDWMLDPWNRDCRKALGAGWADFNDCETPIIYY